jgi:hypothetical protein
MKAGGDVSEEHAISRLESRRWRTACFQNIGVCLQDYTVKEPGRQSLL